MAWTQVVAVRYQERFRDSRGDAMVMKVDFPEQGLSIALGMCWPLRFPQMWKLGCIICGSGGLCSLLSCYLKKKITHTNLGCLIIDWMEVMKHREKSTMMLRLRLECRDVWWCYSIRWEPRRRRILKTMNSISDRLCLTFPDPALWLMVISKLECPTFIFTH